MIEFVVGAWVGGLVLSAPVTALNYRFALKRSKSTKYKTLNHNLEKIGLYWSLSDEAFTDRSTGSAERDAEKTLRTSLLLGCLGFFSLLGLIFLVIISLSLQVLAKSRLTQAVFSSELVQEPHLQPDRIRQLVQDLKSSSL